MCYPKPGPRCSSHVKAELEKVDKELADFPRAVTMLDPQEAFKAYDDLVAQKTAALDRYYTTPAGQEELETQIRASNNPTEQEFLLKKKEEGKASREKALQEYKTSVIKQLPTGWDVTETTPSMDCPVYQVSKPGIELTVKWENDNKDACYITGMVHGHKATLVNASEDGVHENLYVRLGETSGHKDPFGLLSSAETVGLKKKEVTDLLKVVRYYQTTYSG